MQSIGVTVIEEAGYFPFSFEITLDHHTPGGVPFSALHAKAHAWQPMQAFKSMTMPYLGIFYLLCLVDFDFGLGVESTAERVHKLGIVGKQGIVVRPLIPTDWAIVG